jgi:hypothetical protein
MKSNLEAFSAGCDLWVLIDDSNSHWWKEINFQSAFLLSSLQKHKTESFTRSVSNETENILKETEFPQYNFKSNSKLLFIATQNHFQNRWIALIQNATDITQPEFQENIQTLKPNNIRFFFNPNLSPGLKSSFPQLEIISDSH